MIVWILGGIIVLLLAGLIYYATQNQQPAAAGQGPQGGYIADYGVGIRAGMGINPFGTANKWNAEGIQRDANGLLVGYWNAEGNPPQQQNQNVGGGNNNANANNNQQNQGNNGGPLPPANA